MNLTIKVLYKVLYNYFNNQKKHPTSPRLMAWSSFSMAFGIFFINIILTFSMLTGIDIEIDRGKTINAINILLFFTLIYFYLFKWLKVDEMEYDKENGFSIPLQTTRIWWIIFISNFSLFFCLTLLKHGFK